MPWRAAIAIPRTTGTIVAERNGRRVVRSASHPAERRGLTGVPRSADSASKYLRDCASERSEYSKNGTSASSQPHARAAANVTRSPAVTARPQTVT